MESSDSIVGLRMPSGQDATKPPPPPTDDAATEDAKSRMRQKTIGRDGLIGWGATPATGSVSAVL